MIWSKLMKYEAHEKHRQIFLKKKIQIFKKHSVSKRSLLEAQASSSPDVIYAYWNIWGRVMSQTGLTCKQNKANEAINFTS